MKITIRTGPSSDSEGTLLKLAGFSAIAHLVAVIIFSVIPSFARPMTARRTIVAQIIPASNLTPARPPEKQASGPTPSQRADSAKKALEPKPKPRDRPKPKPIKDPDIPPLRKPPPQKPAAPDPDPIESAPPTETPTPENVSPSVEPSPRNLDAGISFSSHTADQDDGRAPSIGSSAFPYDYYRASLMTILQSNWRKPLNPEGLVQPLICRVKFTIMKSGVVQNPSIIEYSGNTILDRSALRAVFDSNPLPPLPFQYPQASVSAEVVFELTSD